MSESEALVAIEVADGLATLTLNRPQRRNALSPALVGALIEALAEIQRRPEARVVVLTGAGGKAFCAGGDLAGGMGADGALDAWRSRGRFADALEALHDLGKPVVAAVNGDALGGGFGLMLACDMVVVADDARLGTPEIKVGLFPMIILAELLRNLPRKLLSELVFTGRHLSAEEALSYGLVNQVAPRAEVLAQAKALAAKSAAFSPAVLRLGKDALTAATDLQYRASLRYLHGQLEANLITEDAMEGISAFLARRAPEWRGR